MLVSNSFNIRAGIQNIFIFGILHCKNKHQSCLYLLKSSIRHNLVISLVSGEVDTSTARRLESLAVQGSNQMRATIVFVPFIYKLI